MINMDERNNSGDWNSGDWNSGDRNSGYFNTNRPKIRMFNKETNLDFGSIIFPIYLYFDLTEWISEECLTEKQKKEHPDYKTLGGWLITYDYKEAAIKSFNENCDKEQAEQTINLPNFDYDIFEEITGITKEMLEEKLKDAITNKKEIIIDGIKYRRVD